ncbi:MAG: hypothetical protein JXR59_05785 [Desulfuromonadaceae bacterium]|nr:hypothetical protein [Desulfuromonadaceae bacterium]
MVGLCFFSDGFSLAKLRGCAQAPQVDVLESVTAAPADCGAALQRLVQQYQLAALPAVAVMARGSYNLIQVERPAVPEEEVLDALRWQVKDLLDFSADQAVLDYVAFDQIPGGQALNFVVAASRLRVAELVKLVRDTAGLELQAIDIPELVLRQLLRFDERQPKGLALLCLWAGSGLVLVVQNDQLCLARRIHFGLDELVSLADPDAVDGVDISEAQQAVLDSIVLEVQRSLDYYESHVARQSISRVLIAPLAVPVPGLVDYMTSYLAPEILPLPMAQLFPGLPADSALQSHGLAAVAAALRGLEGEA